VERNKLLKELVRLHELRIFSQLFYNTAARYVYDIMHHISAMATNQLLQQFVSLHVRNKDIKDFVFSYFKKEKRADSSGSAP